MPENLDITPSCLTAEVNKPTSINIKPCPKANKNNINIARAILLETDAILIIPANIGVEQGVVANANTKPKMKG